MPWIRAIDYEFVSGIGAARLGLLNPEKARHAGHLKEVVLLRCVDGGGQKLTAVGDASAVSALFESGETSGQMRIELPNRDFPILRQGWIQAG